MIFNENNNNEETSNKLFIFFRIECWMFEMDSVFCVLKQ